MYTPVLYFGDEMKRHWERYNREAFSGRPNMAKMSIKRFESALIKDSVTDGIDPDPVLGKLDDIKAVLGENISEEGRREKLIDSTRELVNLMDEEYMGGNVTAMLSKLTREFSRGFMKYMATGNPELADDLIDILDKMVSLHRAITDEDFYDLYLKFMGTLGEMEGAISDMAADKRKGSSRAAGVFKKLKRQANKLMGYREGRAIILEEPDTGEGEPAGAVDGAPVTKGDLKDMLGGEEDE